MNNLVSVSLCVVVSDYFSAVNGVKQGAVLSPAPFCLYINDLSLLLVKAGIGCKPSTLVHTLLVRSLTRTIPFLQRLTLQRCANV
jgi:hypothetical protein